MKKNEFNPSIVSEVEALLVKGKETEHRNTQEALLLGEKALQLSKEFQLPRQTANSYVLIGRCHWINGNFEEALECFSKTLDICDEFQSDHSKVEAIIGIGNVYLTIKMYDQALTNYNQALDICKEQEFDVLESKILNNIGAMHEELKSDEKALEYYHQSLNKSFETNDHYGMAIAHLNIANMNLNLKKTINAHKYLEKAVLFAEQNEKTLLLAHAYFTYGTISQLKQNYVESIEKYQIAIEKALESKDHNILFLIYIKLARSYTLKGDFEKAEEIYNKSLKLANQIGTNELKVKLYEQMATFYQSTDNDQKALRYYQKYQKANEIAEENRIEELRKTIEYHSKLSDSMEETKVYKKLTNELERSYSNIKMLSEIGQTMTSTLEIDKIFEKLYDNINTLMNAEALSVSLYDKEANVLHFDLQIERGEYLSSFNLSLDNQNSLAVWSFLNKQTIKINDVEQEHKKYIHGFKSTKGELMYSVMIAPLIVEGDVIGTFSIQAKEKNAYTEAHKILLQTLASYLAISIKNATKTIELAKLNKILKAKSERDGLTGISNRRLFDETYVELWNEAIKKKEPISVVIFDIDNFKHFNDELGHLVGDEVIKLVAEALDVSKSSKDFVARYGGDEFVAILPNSTTEYRAEFDKKLRENLKLISKKLKIKKEVTISLGIATTYPSKDDEPKKLIYTADNQLYKSKADGKNRTSELLL